MTAQSVTLRGRRAAEARMVDACTIREPGTTQSIDPDTGLYTTTPGDTVYSGKCEIQVSDGLNARETEAGGAEITLSRVTLKIPVSAEGVRANHVATIDASLLDADLVGQEFRVLAGHAKSFATARRLQVERVTT